VREGKRSAVRSQIETWYFEQLTKLSPNIPISNSRHPQEIIKKFRNGGKIDQSRFIPLFYNDIKPLSLEDSSSDIEDK
ncbi:MAG: hypothetical protein V2B13_03520, partial [Pseudomonadota bacterium]